jgi:hypothetical protein
MKRLCDLVEDIFFKKRNGKIMMSKRLRYSIANPEFELGAISGKKMETDRNEEFDYRSR